MEGIKNETQYTDLPYDIRVNILCRLPMKSLIRCKAVSKQWNATISDPEFAEIHLHHSKNSSSCKNLFVRVANEPAEFQVVKFENGEFRILSSGFLARGRLKPYGIIHYCDGLLLRRFGNIKDKMYVLSNPSSATCKKFSCPYPIDDSMTTLHGICYDPLMRDYKVVIADKKHYVVFHCRNDKWTEMREMINYSCRGDVFDRHGVSCNGSFYWVLTSRIVVKRGRCISWFEIVCFDGRDEKFKMLPLPECNGDADRFYLACLGGRLCLFLYRSDLTNEIRIMKRAGNEGSWMEVNALLPFPFMAIKSVCLVNENEIIFSFHGRSNCILYNQSKDTSAEIQYNQSKDTSAEIQGAPYSYLAPYLENLFSLQDRC